MTIDEFNDTIDFAVSREREAVEFYAGLQASAHFHAQRIMLKELESMEQGHILALEELRRKGVDHLRSNPRKEAVNLRISEYLVESSPEASLTYQDILIIAMKREERSHALYSDLAKEFVGTELETVLKRIAAEESEHKFRFERLYDEEVLKGN
jgi:rubrerythrin